MKQTSAERITAYKDKLIEDELSNNTISKYIRDAQAFENWLNGRDLTKTLTIQYKEQLKEKFKTSTVNNKIITLNKYLKFNDRAEETVKNIKVQATELDEVMSQNDYERIYRQAREKGTTRDLIMLDALYETGLRVSELQFLTVEANKQGYITVNNKGKIRNVPITKTLKKRLDQYIKEQGITTGTIILNPSGEPLSRYTVFNRLKWLGGQARVKKTKVYPHSIRHLFAKNWLARNGNNVLQLADILGHSSLETTRIYTKLDINETRATME